MAAWLETAAGVHELQQIVQQLVIRPDFVLPAAGTNAQLRDVREWELPTAQQCPALHRYLPDAYGLADFYLDCGHNSPYILTREERRADREHVPYHRHAPEPSEVKAEDKALLPPAAVTADNAQREAQVALRPRINSLVYMLATLFDPNVDLDTLRDRLAPILHSQLRLVWDEWAKRDQDRRSKLLTALQQSAHRFDSRGDIARPSILTTEDRDQVARRVQLHAAQNRAFGAVAGDGGGRGRGNGGNGGRGNGGRGRGNGGGNGGNGGGNGGGGNNAGAAGTGGNAGHNAGAGKGGKGAGGGKGGKGGCKQGKGKGGDGAAADPPAAQLARDANEADASAAAGPSN
jgi:hypothetical protein